MNATQRPPSEPALVTRLVEQHGAERLVPETFERFVATPGETVLFFTEDPLRVREVNDVAVILPELVRVSRTNFRIGILPPPLANAKAATYGVRRWPALAFLRGGEWLGNIEGLRDWNDYTASVAELLSGPARALPARVIPIADPGSASCF